MYLLTSHWLNVDNINLEYVMLAINHDELIVGVNNSYQVRLTRVVDEMSHVAVQGGVHRVQVVFAKVEIQIE